MLNNNTLIKIISLIAAVCLWVYVMGEIDPNKKINIGNVPVTFTGTEALAEKDLAVVQEDEIFINVMISGKRSEVNDIRKTGLTAYVDVTDCEKGKNTGKININLPDGIKLENISQSTLRFKVEELVSEKKPVVIDFTAEANGGGSTVDRALELSPETVTVRGAKSSVKKVTHVKGTVDSQKVSEQVSKQVNVEVVPVTKENVRVYGVEPSEHNVRVNVQRLVRKSMKLEVAVKNVEDGYAVDKITGVDTVSIAGPADVIKNMDKIEGVIDLSGIVASATVEVIPDLPEYIFLLDEDEPLSVTVTMKAAQ